METNLVAVKKLIKGIEYFLDCSGTQTGIYRGVIKNSISFERVIGDRYLSNRMVNNYITFTNDRNHTWYTKQ